MNIVRPKVEGCLLVEDTVGFEVKLPAHCEDLCGSWRGHACELIGDPNVTKEEEDLEDEVSDLDWNAEEGGRCVDHGDLC